MQEYNYEDVSQAEVLGSFTEYFLDNPVVESDVQSLIEALGEIVKANDNAKRMADAEDLAWRIADAIDLGVYGESAGDGFLRYEEIVEAFESLKDESNLVVDFLRELEVRTLAS